MRAFLVAAAVTGVVSAAAVVGFTQAKPAGNLSIEGVWKGTTQTATGPNAVNIPDRQPNIVIYTKKYYGRVAAEGAPRAVLTPPKDAAKISDAEKLARYEHWTPWTPVAGTYEIKGTQYVTTTIVARDQSANVLKGGTPGAPQETKFEGKTLVLTATSADGKSVIRRTYTRLDQPAAAATKPHPIEGVWKGTSVVATGVNAASNPNRQPSIFIYKSGYYTVVRQDAGPVPLPTRAVLPVPKDPNRLTNAEKLARYEHWAPVAGAAGRYEVKGTTLYHYDLVNKNQTAEMLARNKTGNLGTVAPNSELAFSNGNTMVQMTTSTDGKTVTRRTYTRLE
jgi:hypothetical protein